MENRNRKPKRNEVAEWIHGAWSNVQEVTVRNSFCGAGIRVDEVVPLEEREELEKLLLEGPDDGVLMLDDSKEQQCRGASYIASGGGGRHFKQHYSID